MSSTVSRLKSAGIAEEHGKKVRLTAYCLSAWGNMKKEDRDIISITLFFALKEFFLKGNLNDKDEREISKINTAMIESLKNE